MRGTVAKRLRREAAKLDLPVLGYEVKDHIKTVNVMGKDGNLMPMVVVRKQVLLSACTRLIYKGLKGAHYGFA